MHQIPQLLCAKAQRRANCEHANIKTFFSPINANKYRHLHVSLLQLIHYQSILLRKYSKKRFSSFVLTYFTEYLLHEHLYWDNRNPRGKSKAKLCSGFRGPFRHMGKINKYSPFPGCHRFPISLSTSAILYQCWKQGMLPVQGDTSVQSFPPPRLLCAGHTAAAALGARVPHPAAPCRSHPANPSEHSGASDFHLPDTTKQMTRCHWMALASSFIFRRKSARKSTAWNTKCLR